jgi:hypothetical protein
MVQGFHQGTVYGMVKFLSMHASDSFKEIPSLWSVLFIFIIPISKMQHAEEIGVLILGPLCDYGH